MASGTAVLVVAQAFCLGDVVSRVFLEGATFDDVKYVVGLLALVVAGRAILATIGETLAQRAATRTSAQLRASLLAHVVRLGPVWLSGERRGQVATLATRGVDSVEPYVARYLPSLVVAIIVPLTVGVAILTQDFVAARDRRRHRAAHPGVHGPHRHVHAVGHGEAVDAPSASSPATSSTSSPGSPPSRRSVASARSRPAWPRSTRATAPPRWASCASRSCRRSSSSCSRRSPSPWSPSRSACACSTADSPCRPASPCSSSRPRSTSRSARSARSSTPPPTGSTPPSRSSRSSAPSPRSPAPAPTCRPATSSSTA